MRTLILSKCLHSTSIFCADKVQSEINKQKNAKSPICSHYRIVQDHTITIPRNVEQDQCRSIEIQILLKK